MKTWFSPMGSVPKQFFWLTGKGTYVFSAIPDGTGNHISPAGYKSTGSPSPHQWCQCDGGKGIFHHYLTSVAHFRYFSDIISQSQLPSQYFCTF